MEVYPEYAHCFSCGYRIPISEVRDVEAKEAIKKKEPEDISKEILRISLLERTRYRGLILPKDNKGVYIVWPSGSFYKRRVHEGVPRYVGPRGHKVPLFILEGQSKDTLVIVEGELNALSLQEGSQISQQNLSLVPICSPGSATELGKHLDYYLRYSNIFIIVDKDKPGVINGLKLKNELLRHGKRVTLLATEKDCNEILQTEGKEGLLKWCQDMGVPLWV